MYKVNRTTTRSTFHVRIKNRNYVSLIHIVPNFRRFYCHYIKLLSMNV